MRNGFIVILLAAAACVSAAVSCDKYDDSDILARLDALESKVSILQQQVAGINNEISALKVTLEAIANEDVVVGIAEVVDNGKSGWRITYRKGGTVTIFPSAGAESKIGVREIDGVLYWTWGGSLLLDDNGKRIPAAARDGADGADGNDGITPQVKVESGYWWVSYDKGATWTRLEKATAEGSASGSSSSVFRSASVVDGNLVLVLNNGTTLTVPVTNIVKPTVFDENLIAFSVAAISDVHIGNGYGSEAKFTSALSQLKMRAAEKDADGLDGVMVVGDLVNTATNSQITTFKNLYEAQLDPVKVPMIYTIGNHDMNPNYRWTASTVQQNAVFHNILGEDYFLTDQDETMRTNFECRHCIVGGYHILAVTPNGTSPIVYNYNVLTWLDSQLKAITEAEPDKYVIVLTHPMIYNTCYGSLLQDTYTNLGEYWSTKALSETLGKYPQVITFGGHLHFPLNDPRSIWQGEFTALGCASTSYMAIENGAYENMTSTPTVMNDAGEFSQGLLVQFDANGFVRFTRMDFYNQTVIGQPWEANPPVADKSHLEKYNHTALKSTNTAPVLSDISVNGSTVTFAAGTDDEFVHHYVVTLRQGSSVIATKRVLADFYKVPQTSMMKKSHSVSFGSLADGEYTVSVVAVDSWDAQSDPLEKTFTKGEAVFDLASYLGDYTLTCKIFEDGQSTVMSGTVDVVFSASGETPNNVSISGLYQNAVLPARIEPDSSTGGVKLGLFFDGAKGQALSTPVVQGGASYGYVAFLPGLGTKFIDGSYQFIPSPIASPENNLVWWGSASGDGSTFSFNNGNKQLHNYSGTNYYVIAISCVLSSTETLSSSSFASKWNKVYQANPNNNITTGMTFTKK